MLYKYDQLKFPFIWLVISKLSRPCFSDGRKFGKKVETKKWKNYGRIWSYREIVEPILHRISSSITWAWFQRSLFSRGSQKLGFSWFLDRVFDLLFWHLFWLFFDIFLNRFPTVSQLFSWVILDCQNKKYCEILAPWDFLVAATEKNKKNEWLANPYVFLLP